MYPIVYQQLTNTILKDALLHYKKASFTVSKTICYFQLMNLYYNTINTRVRDKKRLEKVGNLVKNSYLYR